jgi:hypothetical protein
MTSMTKSRSTAAGERVVEPMIALARCSKLQPVIVAGSKSAEFMFELHRRGHVRVATTANCGHPAGQYDVAPVDWRQRTFKTLETTLDWLVEFLSPAGVLVVWVDPQKPAARQDLHSALERRGFAIEAGAVHDYGSAVSARRREMNPLPKAA